MKSLQKRKAALMGHQTSYLSADICMIGTIIVPCQSLSSALVLPLRLVRPPEGSEALTNSPTWSSGQFMTRLGLDIQPSNLPLQGCGPTLIRWTTEVRVIPDSPLWAWPLPGCACRCGQHAGVASSDYVYVITPYAVIMYNYINISIY